MYDSTALLTKIGEESKKIEIAKAVNAVANVAKEAISGQDELIDKIATLITDVVVGPMSNIGLNKATEIATLIDDTKAVTDKLGMSGVEVLNRVYVLAKVAIGGEDESGNASTLGDVYFDFDGLMATATTTEKVIGVAAGAVVATTMYFVANDKLVEIVGNVLGDDDTLGALIAEHLGYTSSAEGYTFDGKENELASAIFEIKVTDLITKGYDFAGLYNDTLEPELTAENVALMLKAVNTKYDTNERGLAIGNEVLDQIVGLYGSTKIADVPSATKELDVRVVIDSLESIVKAAFKDSATQTKIEHAAKLVSDLLTGQMKNVTVAKDSLTLGTLCDDVYAVVTDFVTDAKTKEIIKVAFDEVCAMFGSETVIASMGKKAEEIFVDTAIQSAANITIVAISADAAMKEKVQHVVDLAKYAAAGYLTAPALEAEMGIKTTLTLANAILGDYVSGSAFDTISFIIDEIAQLYTYEATEDGKKVTKERFITDIAGATLDIELDSLVDMLEHVLVRALGNDKYESIGLNKYVYLLGVALGGTIGNPDISLESAWNDERLTDTDRIVIIAVGAAVGVAAYFAINDTVVSLVTDMFGDQTVGEIVGEALGYTQNASENWEINGIINNLTNDVFKVKAKTFVNRSQYDIVENVKPNLSIGNVLGSASMIMDAVNEALPEYTSASGAAVKLALTKNELGEWTIGLDEFDNVVTLLLNTTYPQIEDYVNAEDKSTTYLGGRIDALTLSDLGAGFAISSLGTADSAIESGIDIKATYNKVTKTWKYSARTDAKRGTFDTLCNVVFNITVKELREAFDGEGFRVILRKWLQSLTFGDVLGDAMVAMSKTDDNEYLHSMSVTYDTENGVWIADGKYKTLSSNIMNLNMYEATQLLKQSTDNLVEAVLVNVRFGELLGRIFDVDDEGNMKFDEGGNIVWLDENGDVINFASLSRGRISQVISDMLLTDFIANDYDIGIIINDLYIGEVMDYTYEYADDEKLYVLDPENGSLTLSGGAYIDATDSTPKLERYTLVWKGGLAKVEDPENPGTYVYVAADENTPEGTRKQRVWTSKKGNKVTDTITNIVLNYTVGEFSTVNLSTDLMDKVDRVFVSEFFGNYPTDKNDPDYDQNQIFKMLTEEQYNASTLGNMANIMNEAINDASLQTFITMGLLKEEMFAEGEMLSILNDYVDDDGNTGIAYIKLSNLSDAVESCFNKATMSKLMSIGVITLTDKQVQTLDKIFKDAETPWRDMPINDLFGGILDEVGKYY